MYDPKTGITVRYTTSEVTGSRPLPHDDPEDIKRREAAEQELLAVENPVWINSPNRNLWLPRDGVDLFTYSA